MSAQVRLVIVAVLLSACYFMEVKGNADRAIATGPLPSPPKTQSPMPRTRRESSLSLSWDSYPTKNPYTLYLVPVIVLAVVISCAVYHICYRPRGIIKRLLKRWHRPPSYVSVWNQNRPAALWCPEKEPLYRQPSV